MPPLAQPFGDFHPQVSPQSSWMNPYTEKWLTSGPPNITVPPNLATLPSLPPNKPHPKIKVTLENSSLWKIFNKIGTEMIITKSGRRMFPIVKFRISGLEPDSEYTIMLDMMPMDACRHKFHQSKWVISGKAEPRLPGRVYIHPDSPCSGRTWMATQILSFHRIKLTNNNLDKNGHVS